MTIATFQEAIQRRSGVELKLKINDNRSTMLSVRWEPDCTKVSMHRMFLHAPKNVMQALACYIRQEHDSMSPAIKAFIEEGQRKLDYSHTLDIKKLSSRGSYYNLQKIYDSVNEEYFDNQLDLTITWFGKLNLRNRNQVTFGLYQDSLKLIKVHRLLDSPVFPDYLISYVVYHEMLHHVCPSYVDERGIHRIHSKEFKEKEIEFKHYHLAIRWVNEHQAHLF